MLAVGCRFTEVLTDWRRMPVPRQLVQIDLEAGQIGMNYPVTVGIVADARAALAELSKHLPERSARPGWGPIWDEARTASVPRPEWLIETLRAELPETTAVFTDACEIGYRMHADWPSFGPRQFFYPSNYIALGWAFPAALGAAVALPGRHVVSVSGDGGFLMTAQELATAVRVSPSRHHGGAQRRDLRRDQEHPEARLREPLSRRGFDQSRFPCIGSRVRRPGPPGSKLR